MEKNRFEITFLLLVIAQILTCNYFHFSYYVTLSILPLLVLCLPLRTGMVGSLLIAAAVGLAVDLLADGVAGLNAAALIPVAFVRRGVIGAVFGSGVFARNEDISIRKHGRPKFALAIVLVQALFLLVYIALDGAWTRPLWFNALRFAASLLAGEAVSLLLAGLLVPDDRKK